MGRGEESAAFGTRKLAQLDSCGRTPSWALGVPLLPPQPPHASTQQCREADETPGQHIEQGHDENLCTGARWRHGDQPSLPEAAGTVATNPPRGTAGSSRFIVLQQYVGQQVCKHGRTGKPHPLTDARPRPEPVEGRAAHINAVVRQAHHRGAISGPARVAVRLPAGCRWVAGVRHRSARARSRGKCRRGRLGGWSVGPC